MLTHLDFEQPDYVAYIQQIAENFKAKLSGNHFVLPQSVGNGYLWAEKLPGGMTVMVIHANMKQNFTFTQLPLTSQYFCLQFNEYSSEVPAKATSFNKNKYGHEMQSAVRLSHTLCADTCTLPEGVILKSVCFFFNKEQLSSLIGGSAMDDLLTKYFPFLITNESLEPIATDYRVTLNELQVEKIDVPLRLNFIQNRVLLLLEKFIVSLFERKDISTGKLKRTDDETLRLMKVEALLVNNFTVAPPTIDELSRISAMSPTKLKNDFKNLYGFPIYVYYQKNRMLKAKSLLLLGKYSIKEVGVMVGYSNLSHFASTFKKEFSILPSAVSAKDGVLVYNT